MGQSRADGGRSSYGPPRGERELAAFAEIASACFNVSEEDARAWFRRGGERNLRLFRAGGAVAAGLLLVPMGQWFGGRSVPMTGIAGVGVPAERRGRGAARTLMRAALTELRRSGLALSTLYPSTTTLYRSVGFEVAGGRHALSLQLGALRAAPPDRGLGVRRATPADEPAIARVASEVARAGAGQLDRGEYIWRRVRQPRDRIVRDVVIEGRRGVEGYAYLSQRDVSRPEGAEYEILATDAAAVTPAAGRRLLALLGDHAGIAKRAVLYGGPAHPLLMLLPERHYSVALVDPWMLRIVDLRAALERRGWPAGVQAELQLELSDEVLPGNAGTWRLSVAAGAARVTSVARGAAKGTTRRATRKPVGALPALRLDARGLAPLYSGNLSPWQLRQVGQLDGDEAELDLAAALFAGPAPAMSDMF
jgi:predicted acetyltransferase